MAENREQTVHSAILCQHSHMSSVAFRYCCKTFHRLRPAEHALASEQVRGICIAGQITQQASLPNTKAL